MLRTVKYGLYGAVLAGLVATPAVWNTVDKQISLVVDGQPRSVQTTAQSVGQVLHDNGYRLTSHDLLAPDASAPVQNGSRIVLRRGRLLILEVDHTRTEVWTTAPTVAQALAELGYPTTDFVSVSRSRRLPLGVTDIAIRTPQPVTVIHDGLHEQVTTTDGTVAELLSDLEIDLGPLDRVSPSLSAMPTAGMTVRVQRVGKKTITRTEAVPYRTERVRDSALAAGTTKIVQSGRKGQARVTYSVVYVDGKPVGQTKLAAVTMQAPRTQVEKVGTKHVVRAASAPYAPAPSPGSAQAIAKQLLAARGWGDDQFGCLVTLWNHESHWNAHAANPSGAYGIPQALPGSKMSSAGPDWENNAETQIKWGIGYIAARYGTPCGAWSQWQANGGWY